MMMNLLKFKILFIFSARKNAEELKKCLENVVVPMYCNAHSMGKYIDIIIN